MKKKLAIAMALVMACGCIFASCSGKKKPSGNGGTTAPAVASEVPVYVSERVYDYATNPDGSYETVIQTDVEGNTHTYLKGIKPASPNAEEPAGDGNGQPAVEDTDLFEQSNSSVVSDFISALNSGRFRLDGYITTEGEKMPLSFAVYDENIRMGTEVEGIALDFASIDGVTYLLSAKNKTYIELTDSIKERLDLDTASLTFEGFGQIEDDKTVKTTATYNGKTVECYSADNTEGEVKFYVDGDQVVKIEVLDHSGVCTTMIEISTAEGGLSKEDLAIPSDYTKESYIQFIAGVIGDMT